MSKLRLSRILTVTALFSCFNPAWAADPGALAAKPNVLLIVADDLGYSDLGVFGSEIRTPNIDELARSGTLFTRFHAAATCSPTRAMLLSGTDPHLVGAGNMSEHLAPSQRGRPGYEGYLNNRVVTVSSLLKDAGYHTYMVGKWHLGVKDEFGPHSRGFEESYVMLQGGAAHFAQEKPTGLASVSPMAQYRENGKPVNVPHDFFSSKFYTDKLIEYIEHRRPEGKPFFAYAAYPAPHWPLQAPDEYIARYKGRYDGGYDQLRAERLERMKQLGLVAKDVDGAPRASGVPAWEDLDAGEKARSARTMEVYAAMVEAMDHHVGRLVNYLKETEQFENTVIIFISDNGAEGNDISQIEDNAKWVPATFDNSLENIGRKNSYVWLGAGWGQATSQPFRLFKAYPTEGGLTVPAFVTAGQLGKPGRSDVFASAKDIMPTILELTGVPHPGIEYQGRTVFPMQGASMLPHLRGSAPTVHTADYVMGWELFGRRALRKGDWKIVYLFPPHGQSRWQLFNLKDDPSELNDLAAARPDVLNELLLEWNRYTTENNVLPLEADYSYSK